MMKKIFTLMAVVALMATTAFAQLTSAKPMQQAQGKAAIAKMLKANRGSKISGNPIWENTMSYCEDGSFYTGVGTQAAGDTVYWAIKIEAAALVGRNNITEVQFFVPNNGAGTYTVRLAQGAVTTAPIATQTVTAVANDTLTWKSITFATPVAITQGSDLWVIMMNSDVAYPAASITANDYDNAKWVSLDGVEWELLNSSLDVTWMLRAISDTYTVLPPVLSLQGPTSVRVGDTAIYYAHSGNADSFEWTINADYLDTASIMNVASVMWNTTGTQQVIVMASNTAGDTYDTLDVNVYSCDNITLPYAPVFTDGLGCWDTIADSTHGAGWFSAAEMGLNFGQVLSLSAYDPYGIGWYMDIPVDNWLISPEIEMPSTGTYEVAWQVSPISGSYDGDHYGLYVISDSIATLLFEESLTGMTGFNKRMVVLPSTVSDDFQIAFRHFNSAGGYVLILDSIQIRPLTAPVVILDGPAAIENGETATYSALCGNAESFSWAIDGVPVDLAGNVLTNAFTTDGLHTVTVTATNSVSSAVDSVVTEVYSCNGITTFPYTYGFETGLRCWAKVSANSVNDDRFGVFENADAYEGNYVFQFSSYSRATDTNYNQYLISPELSLPQGQYMLKFYYMGYTSAESFRVLASTTNTNMSSFTHVLGTFEQTATEWAEVSFLLPEGTKYVAINYYGNYKYYLYVDNITIKALDVVPSVTLDGPVSGQVGTQLTYIADAPLATSFVWTVDGVDINNNTNTVDVSFDAAGNHTVSVIATNSVGNSTPATLTVSVFSCDGVTEFPWVADFESATGYDCWTFIDADGDGFNWNTNYLRDSEDENGNFRGHNNSHGLVGSASWSQGVGALTPDDWMILPAMTLPENSSFILSWFAKGQDAQYAQEYYSVYISTTGKEISNFTNTVYNGTSTANWEGHNVDLSQYAGQTIYIAFRHHNVTDMFYLDIDDIKISTESVQGIDDVMGVSLNLYPNPATTTVTIEAENFEGNATAQLVDLNGRVVMEQSSNGGRFTFDVSEVARGAYFVRMTGANINAVRKLIVK